MSFDNRECEHRNVEIFTAWLGHPFRERRKNKIKTL